MTTLGSCRLVATEPVSAFPPTRVRIVDAVTVGSRVDFAWVEIVGEPDLGSDGIFGFDYVLIAARHFGFSVLKKNADPIDIYVCTVKDRNLLGATKIDPEEVSIACWALLLDSADERTDIGEIYESCKQAHGNVFQINPVHR